MFKRATKLLLLILLLLTADLNAMKKLASTTSFPIYDTHIPCKILMGWEYEIDIPGIYTYNRWVKEKTAIQKRLGNEFQFRMDGGHYDQSLGTTTCGIEVCSPVAPLYVLKQWAIQLKPFTDKTEVHNGPLNNGGIHVNISKTDFTNAQWPKIKAFLHNPNHYNLLFKLSDRSSQSFGCNARQTLSECENRKYGIITASKSYAYELRMFGAHSDTFLPALEFADALFRYAATVDAITPDEFFSWVDQHKKYQILAAYIHQKLNPNALSLHRPSPRNSVNAQAA